MKKITVEIEYAGAKMTVGDIINLFGFHPRNVFKVVSIKRRPTKRPPDSLKAGVKSAPRRVRKPKVIRPAISG